MSLPLLRITNIAQLTTEPALELSGDAGSREAQDNPQGQKSKRSADRALLLTAQSKHGQNF